ncbi:MAG: phosphate ABC transporter substrate-binding/OmpA family protein [Verrucomicrobia bacterium]|nr:phosphate ABC transporter substrate-binding/OmpA family protein [Verrucomicrobiota bacterium]
MLCPLLPLGAAAALLFPGSARAQAPANQPSVTVLRLHGSNTVGAELVGNLLQEFLAQEGWRAIRRVPTEDPDVYSVQGQPPGRDAVAAVEVAARGTNTGWSGLERNLCDIAMASRRVNEAEAQRLIDLGDMQSPACEHVVALDGLAIFVNPANPVTSLTRSQARDLFTGKIKDWSELTTELSGPINIYARDDKSGTYDSFKAMVLGTEKLAGYARRFEDSRALSDAVAADRQAIGFAGLPFVRSTKALAVADGGAALLPTAFTVRTEDYPLSRRLFLYTAAAPANVLAVKFVRFAKSDAAQRIVAATGFVDQVAQAVAASQVVAPIAPKPSAEAQAVRTEYERLVAGAERIAMNIRFRSGALEVDNKANADLERLTRLVGTPGMRGRRVILVGFSDNRGGPEVNQRVSEERARAVARQLEQRGLKVELARGLGAEFPVASNDTADGREKNRRVEIWVRG